MVSELLNALRDFLVRDALYIVGGASVCVAGLYALDRLPPSELPTALLLLGAGISYGVGLAIQETAGLVHLVRIAPIVDPGRFVRLVYRRLTHDEWLPASYDLWLQQLAALRQSSGSDPRTWAQLQRIISLKQVGITLGSNWLAAATILSARWMWHGQELPDLVLALSCLLTATALLLVAIVKNAQQVQFVCHRREI